MDGPRQIVSALDELRRIRSDIRLTDSLDMVRRSFERVQEIRRQHQDDFDLQLVIADTQQEIIERARALRQASDGVDFSAPPEVEKPRPALSGQAPEEARIPADIPKLDQKSWQLAVGLAVLFSVGIFALFFYMIQTARRLNFASDQAAVSTAAQPPGAAPAKTKPVTDVIPAAVTTSPSLRLYTDLTGGTATIDNQPPQDLSDGELNLNALTPGAHSLKVESRAGSAAFNFALDNDKDVPRVTEILKSNNAMVVLISVKDGKGRLTSDAAGAVVALDEKPAGTVAAEGLLLSDLGTRDHDLEVTRDRDRQKFVLTYTAAPTLTVFVKSDPSTGVLTIATGQDGVSVFINELPYKRLTVQGNIRIPLKVGKYQIRVHKTGFQDPAAALVEVKKSAEAAVQFQMEPAASEFGTLQIKGAQPATTAYVDHQLAATVGADGTARVINVQPGDHLIELHHDLAITKPLTRTFEAGQTVTLTGSDVALDHLGADNRTVIPANPGPPVIPPPEVPQLQPANADSSALEKVHRGGGFVPYHTPKSAGKYYFQAHAKLGGVLKRNKLQWYAGYQDQANYVLFSIDGKHADVREVRNGKSFDVGRVPFNVSSDEWIQIEVTVKADGLEARAKSPSAGWTEFSPVASGGHDFTKESVGLYIPSNDEVAVANFHFSGR